MLNQLVFKASSPASPSAVDPTWRAQEMASHERGGPFNPYDVAVPDIVTISVHGQVEVIPGEPTDYTLEYPEGDQLDRIFPLFPGFGGVKLSSGPFSNAMARLGMPTVTVEPVRSDDRSNWERLTNPHAVHVETMEAALDDLKKTIGFELSSATDGPKAIPLAHSMGGEAALRYAERNHTTTEAVILLATIGFGSPNVGKIIRKVPVGTPTAIREEVIPFLQNGELELSVSGARKAIRYYFRNPLRTVGEVVSCLTSDQSERAHRLRNLGIPTAYGQPVYDLLVQGADGARNDVTVVGEIDRAGHMFVQAKPGRAAHWVRGALNSLGLVIAN